MSTKISTKNSFDVASVFKESKNLLKICSSSKSLTDEKIREIIPRLKTLENQSKDLKKSIKKTPSLCTATEKEQISKIERRIYQIYENLIKFQCPSKDVTTKKSSSSAEGWMEETISILNNRGYSVKEQHVDLNADLDKTTFQLQTLDITKTSKELSLTLDAYPEPNISLYCAHTIHLNQHIIDNEDTLIAYLGNNDSPFSTHANDYLPYCTSFIAAVCDHISEKDCSTLYPLTEKIGENAALYLSNIKFIRNPKNHCLLEAPRKVNLLVTTLPNSSLKKKKSDLNTSQILIRNKLDAMLLLAHLHPCNHLLIPHLDSLGCGNSSSEVAEILADLILNKYRGVFPKITILATDPNLFSSSSSKSHSAPSDFFNLAKAFIPNSSAKIFFDPKHPPQNLKKIKSLLRAQKKQLHNRQKEKEKIDELQEPISLQASDLKKIRKKEKRLAIETIADLDFQSDVSFQIGEKKQHPTMNKEMIQTEEGTWYDVISLLANKNIISKGSNKCYIGTCTRISAKNPSKQYPVAILEIKNPNNSDMHEKIEGIKELHPSFATEKATNQLIEIICNDVKIEYGISNGIRRSNSKTIDPLFPKIYDLIQIKDSKEMLIAVEPYEFDIEALVQTRQLSLEESKTVVKDLLKCLKRLHKLGIAHRDIKPKNVLVKLDEENITKAAFTDFESAVRQKDFNDSEVTPFYTHAYVSPDLAKLYAQDITPTIKNLQRADLWALGLLIKTILFKQHYANFSLFETKTDFPEMIKDGEPRVLFELLVDEDLTTDQDKIDLEKHLTHSLDHLQASDSIRYQIDKLASDLMFDDQTTAASAYKRFCDTIDALD